MLKSVLAMMKSILAFKNRSFLAAKATSGGCAAVLLVAVVGLFSCNGDKAEGDDLASAKQAKEYYEALYRGDVERFLSNTYAMDSIPEDYRGELLENLRVFVTQTTKEHGKLIDIEPLRVEKNAEDSTQNAFLLLVFQDSTKEEIVQRMSALGDRWIMK